MKYLYTKTDHDHTTENNTRSHTKVIDTEADLKGESSCASDCSPRMNPNQVSGFKIMSKALGTAHQALALRHHLLQGEISLQMLPSLSTS